MRQKSAGGALSLPGSVPNGTTCNLGEGQRVLFSFSNPFRPTWPQLFEVGGLPVGARHPGELAGLNPWFV